MTGRFEHDDRGIFAVLYALLVVALFMTAALVVDLSGLRQDRRMERLAADAAVTAGAIRLSPLAGSNTPNAACLEVWRYIRLNLPGAGSAGPACSSTNFPTSTGTCPSVTRTQSAAAGEYEVTVSWPIPNDDPAVAGDSPLLEQPNVTGRGTYVQPPDPVNDGLVPCERMAVTVSRDRDFTFAAIGGFTSGATNNTSVARATLRGDVKQEFPLVVLDQHGCGVLYAHGSVSQDAAIRVVANGLTPGRIAADSAGDLPGNSGHGCDNGNAYVADVNGGGRIVALNGTGGSPGLMLGFAPGAKFAKSTELCALGTNPASVGGGTICPRPTPFNRVTRKYWDWQYHCSPSTTGPLSEPCPYTATRPDYIGQIQTSLGTLTAANAGAQGFTVWPTTADDPAVCDYTAADYRYVAPGNYYVNCTTFNVNNVTVFGGGTVVFRGGTTGSQGIAAKNSGSGRHCLIFNQPVGSTTPPLVSGNYAACAPSSSTVTPAPSGDMIVYLQKGSLTRQNSDFIAVRTLIYQETDVARGGSPTSVIDLGAGTSSNLLITAPTDGNFENLAIWSENYSGVTNAESQANQLGSQNKLALEGILFLPNALVNFGGNPTYLGTARAQFVAFRLAVGGGGTLELLPDPDRTLTIPVAGVQLIR
jgi:hypothetical protein